MVFIQIEKDFSGLDEKVRKDALKDPNTAERIINRLLDTNSIDSLLTTNDTKLTARIVPKSNWTTSEIYIAPEQGNHITNIDALMRQLRRKPGIMIHATREPETIRFTRSYGGVELKFCIKTRTLMPGEVNVDLSEVDDTPLTSPAPPAEPKKPSREYVAPAKIIEIPAIKSAKTPNHDLEAIAQYLIAGERKLFEIISRHDAGVSKDLASILQRTIQSISTSDGRSPLITYNKETPIIKIEVFPQAGSTVTDVQIDKNSALYDEQRKGVISCRSGKAHVNVHRRNIYEKFDLRGSVETDRVGKTSIIAPPEEDAQAILRALQKIPLIIMTDDDSELTLTYQTQFHPQRAFMMPKKGSHVVLAGATESTEKGTLTRRYYTRENGPTEIEILDREILHSDGTGLRYIIIFPAPGPSNAHWEDSGGAGKKDCFDIFYEKYLAKSNGQ
jgi:hypothetical protein